MKSSVGESNDEKGVMLEEIKYLISILVSVVLGFAIGYERKLRFKEAGIRTHTIYA